jgi:PKD repeat protein
MKEKSLAIKSGRLWGAILALLIAGFFAKGQRCATDLVSQPGKPAWEFSAKGQSDNVFFIPVVVHVIHNEGEEKIKEAQVHSQLRALNRDFRRYPGTVGFGSGVDMQIEFALARRDPWGEPTGGINYLRSPLTEHRIDAQEVDLKRLIFWPSERYLNIWVVKSIEDAQGKKYLGYARYPSEADQEGLDGIVVAYYAFGTTGALKPETNLGRTLTHEVGHWLGLYHTFQGGCHQDCRREGDYICDTPPTKEPNYHAPQRQNTCFEPNDKPDQTRNYMDYGNDLHLDLFTAEQKEVARRVLTNTRFPARFSVWQAENIQKTQILNEGAPLAHFFSSTQVTCPGALVQFYSQALQNANEYFWIFEGGIPSFSNQKNPQTVYPSPGKYDVTLIVKNRIGRADTLLIPQYIQVLDSVYRLPYVQDFEEPIFPPLGWALINEDNATPLNRTFTRSATSGAQGRSRGSARLNFFSYNGYGQKDALLTPIFDIANLDSVSFSFWYAYQGLESEAGGFLYHYSDTLALYYSTDCGNHWDLLWKKGGADLATLTPPFSSTPLISAPPNAWKNVIVALSFQNTKKDKIQFQFRTVNGSGNNLYIDDILCLPYPSVITSLTPFRFSYLPIVKIRVPAPKEKIAWEYELKNVSDLIFEITDALGKLHYRLYQQNLAPGSYTQQCALSAPGLYYLWVKANAETQVIKLSVY